MSYLVTKIGFLLAWLNYNSQFSVIFQNVLRLCQKIIDCQLQQLRKYLNLLSKREELSEICFASSKKEFEKAIT